jgi:hypothetical protein
VTGAEPFAEVDRLIGAAPPADLPAIVGRLVELEERARLRLRVEANGNGREEDRLLDVPEVAQVLSVAVDYAYTLVRQRKIPTVRLPGLDKGGKGREGKYVRVRLSALRAWAEEREDKGIDGVFSTVIKSLHDRQRGAKDPKGARAVASRVRQARGRDLRDGEPLGDGSYEHPGAHGEAHPAPRASG